MASDHSMASDVSGSEPPVGSWAGRVVVATVPFANTTVKFAAGKPNCAEKVARSLAAVGSSKASTRAIAPPPPVGFCVVTFGLQLLSNGGAFSFTRWYTQAIEAGVSKKKPGNGGNSCGWAPGPN